MKNYRVSKPCSSIDEWVIEKRSFIFWWVFTGEIFSSNIHALKYCKALNEAHDV